MILQINGDDVNFQKIGDAKLDAQEYISATFESGVLDGNTIFFRCDDIDVGAFDIMVYNKSPQQSEEFVKVHQEYLDKFLTTVLTKAIEHAENIEKGSNND